MVSATSSRPDPADFTSRAKKKMTTLTGYREQLDAELETIDRRLSDAALRDPVSTRVFGAPDPAAERDDLLLEGGGHSLPDSQALWAIFRKALQTKAPILAADFLSLAIAGIVARLIIAWAFPEAASWALWMAPLALMPMFVGYWLTGLYTEIWVHPAVELRQLSHVTTIGLLGAAAGGIIARPISLWFVAAWPAAVVLVPLLRTVARSLCSGQRWWGYPTLVVAAGEGLNDVTRVLIRDSNTGLRPILLTDPTGACRHSVLPVINDPGQLESMIAARSIRHAVVALPQMGEARLTEVLDRYNGLVPHMLVLSDTSTLPTLWSTSRRCGRLTGIEVRNGLMMATMQGVKRMIDLSIAFTALLLSLPLLVVIAVLVKRSSPGPIFFGHQRIGLHGRRFKAWKFRTMKQNADAILEKYLEKHPAARLEWERDHKLRHDPRVTAFGRIARRLSLDELPQLWNVLIGDMALVGPRPIVDKEVWRYGKIFRLYTKVKPGITGMWQVSGRNDIGYEERVLLDQFYIRHWSPWLDIYILAKTVVALLDRQGAY